MKLGVKYKLFLVILMAAGLAVVSSAVIMQWSLDRGFLNYINSIEKTRLTRLAARLEESYHIDQSWELLRRDPSQWRLLISDSLPETGPQRGNRMLDGPPPDGTINDKAKSGPHWGGIRPDGPPPEGNEVDKGKFGPPHMLRHFDQRLFLLDADRKVLVSRVEVPVDSTATPLMHQGKVVGYLGLLPLTNVSDVPQKRFLKEQKLVFALVAGFIVLLSGVLSFLVARRLVRPLKELAQATQRLASGDFIARVPVTSHDELGLLANNFNSLALALEKGEQTRRQWVADISHELRTPLAILRGEIEALQDGIRQPNSDNIQSLHGEVTRLSRLVDDLFQLSLSDVGALTYRKTELDLREVLMKAMTRYQSEFSSKGISLDHNLSGNVSIEYFGDPERLHQLFSNLFDNALKYTDIGGKLNIALQQRENSVTIDFQDSTPGVQPSELDRLFKRLYRVESSRNRTTGGAGLGLSICRNIVDAHGGSIIAKQSPLGGLWIRIELPRGNS